MSLKVKGAPKIRKNWSEVGLLGFLIQNIVAFYVHYGFC